ncbi:MAG: YqgE/AlgH family protein [Betaproteobacteria bacterium]|nr:YqgE/AlgH family protein [Betaproteobacteria bacterium]
MQTACARRIAAGALAALLLTAAPARGQADDPPNGLLLVAKPGLPDPRFRNTVVLVTQTRDFQTVGVILNRPLQATLRELRPDMPAEAYSGRLFYGGPVMERVLLALFRSESTPPAAAFHVLRNVYLSMHPAVVEPLVARPTAGLRLFAGFSGWAPRQLESELKGESWYLLPATEDVVFREDTSRLWEELVERARSRSAALYWIS